MTIVLRAALAFALALLSTALVAGQVTQTDLDEAVKQAVASRDEYIRRFRDLTAVETWSTELLRRDGTVEKRRTVISDFFVYQSRIDPTITREYRITREIDGKAARDPVV